MRDLEGLGQKGRGAPNEKFLGLKIEKSNRFNFSTPNGT
jgi:hypothetical protein